MNRNVWRTSKAGAIDRLALIEEEMGILEKNHVRIKVHTVGLNFADIFALTGLYSATPEGSFIPGLEYCGEIIEVGDGVSSYHLGQKVMGVTRFGGYASHIDTTIEFITPLPETWSYEQGASYLVQTLTAYYALTELGNLKPKQNIFIQSAAGGVGLQAMKLVQALNATPIGCVGSSAKKAFLAEQGFDQVIVRDELFKAKVAELPMFNQVLDGVGGEIQKICFDHLSPMGRLIVFGAAEFTPGKNRPNYLSAAWKYLTRPKYDVMDMISTNKSVMAFNLIWLWEQVEYLNTLLHEMQQIDIAPPHVGHVFMFENALDAIECLRQGNNLGKVILKVG